MEAPHKIAFQLKLLRVAVLELVIPESLQPSGTERDHYFTLQTHSNFEFGDGRIDIVFTVTGSIVDNLDNLGSGSEIFRAIVRCETEIGFNDKPLPEEAIPMLNIEVYQMLVREAFATTRGVLIGSLRDSPLSNLVLPYTDPNTFLQDDIGEMLRTKKFVGKRQSD